MAGNRAQGDPRSAAEKLFAIADAFAGPGSGELTLTEIAARSKLPLSTAHRLLAEWVEWGGIVRGEDGRYRIGVALWKLGVRSPTTRRLRAVAFPYLEDLYEITRENVHLAIRDGMAALYVERLASRDAARIISDVGSRLPLHATGVGLVLLANAPAGVFEELIAARPQKYLPNTMTGEAELRSRLAEVRATGIAISVDEMTDDTFSAAAPVRDHTNQVIAAVGVVAHARQSTDPQYQAAVRVAARGMSRALGWKA